MNKKIKPEFLPGGARRQEMLDQVPNYLTAPGLQANKHMLTRQSKLLTLGLGP